MDISNYTGATLAAPESIVSASGDKWLLVYNNSTVLTNGAVKEISYLVDTGTINADASTSKPMIVCVAKAPATSAGEITIIGVVDNTPLGLETIAAGAYGYVKVQGVVQALVDGDSVDVTVGCQLQVIGAGLAFKYAGVAEALMVPECSAIALVANTSTAALKYVHLLGKQTICNVAA
jgi:hypothetical protein